MSKSVSSMNEELSDDKMDEYREVFNILDKNNTGTISTDVIIKLRKIFSYPINEKGIKKMINEIDTYKDGTFDFNKFVIFIKKQIQYIDENDKDIILKSFKEDFENEYLGNKRKRENANNEESSKYEEELELIKSEYPMEEEIKDSEYNIKIKEEDSLESVVKISSENSSNFSKKRKIKDEKNDTINNDIITSNSNSKTTTQNNIKNDINKENVVNDNKNTKKNNEENKQINELNENNKLNNDIELPSNIIIYKSNLEQDLINEIEIKNENKCFSKIENNNININKNYDNNNIKYKNIWSKRRKSRYSSNFISEFDINNINNFNSGENSFSSDLNLEQLNKSFFSSYSINSRLDRIPTFKIKQKKKKLINNSSKKLLEGIKERLNNIGIDSKLNKKKFSQDSEKKNQLKDKLRKIVNDNFYGTYSNNIDKEIKINDSNINNENIIKNEKTINEIEVKEKKINETNKIENFINIEEKIKKINIQILNTFLFEYKSNKNGEKIIKKSLEIPYLIIIEKSGINMSEMQNQTKIDYPDNTEKISSSKIKRKTKKKIKENETFSLKNKTKTKSNDNKNKSKNKGKEKEKKEKIEIKSEEIDNNREFDSSSIIYEN